jgi:hypothetical protein
MAGSPAISLDGEKLLFFEVGRNPKISGSRG